MPSLQVRELPDNIYNLLQAKAKAGHRSLAQEAVVTLAKGLRAGSSHKERRKKLLQSIVASGATIPKEVVDGLDPLSMIREDRGR